MNTTWALLFLILVTPLTHAMGHNVVGQSLSRPCATCHGQNGQSLNPAWPHLAGQHTSYLEKQLHDLKSNKTRHPDDAMAPFIMHLTDEDIANIALFYTNQPAPIGTHRHRKPNQHGQSLYRATCAICHGIEAKGNGLPGFPALAGQQLTYITHQLEAFKTGERDNDPSHAMRQLTQALSPEDIYDLAYYLASLPH
jgi:cytochrome c553